MPNAARDDREAFIVMENPTLEFTSNHKDWCAIASTFVVSCALCIVGFILLAYKDVSTGTVLLFVSGSILTLTACAVLGKYQSADMQPEDRPPSYRTSWRHSFMRRTRQTNNQNETEETLQPGIVPLPTSNSNRDLPDIENEFSFSARILQMNDGGFVPDTRRTRSLANIIDPPSYEDVLIAMDENTKRKLKSELCLPSFTDF